VWYTKAVEWIARQESETSKHRQYAELRESARRVQSGYQAAADRVQRVAVEDLVLSQEDKPKRHRSARETAILRSSVYRIIHRDLQLTGFKRCRVQLLSEANCISRLTR